MNDLDNLFKKSNYVLFGAEVVSKEVKDIVIARTNLARSISITDTNNTEFDKLIHSLENSLEISDDLMALSLISRINSAVVSISGSFDSILNLMNSTLKQK